MRLCHEPRTNEPPSLQVSKQAVWAHFIASMKQPQICKELY